MDCFKRGVGDDSESFLHYLMHRGIYRVLLIFD